MKINYPLANWKRNYSEFQWQTSWAASTILPTERNPSLFIHSFRIFL